MLSGPAREEKEKKREKKKGKERKRRKDRERRKVYFKKVRRKRTLERINPELPHSAEGNIAKRGKQKSRKEKRERIHILTRRILRSSKKIEKKPEEISVALTPSLSHSTEESPGIS